MQFTKMHGLGNDFILVDCLSRNIDTAEMERNAIAICDRRFGVGGDGLIFLLPSNTCDVRMRIINSDGSEAEMCGNGVRCLAKYVYDHGIISSENLSVETLAGTKSVRITARNGKAELVRVGMGAPEFQRSRIPMAGEDIDLVRSEPLAAGGVELAVTCVSMGNPHCVSFVDDVNEFPVAAVGPDFERHPVFPNRTNVEFVEVVNPNEIRMRVWERGAGETLACGTGACASAVASALNEKTGKQVLVHLAGGDLNIDWAADNNIFMTGPATEVFSGEIDVSVFSES